MPLRRNLVITEAAYAVLREMKRGDLAWQVTRTPTGMVQIEVEGEVYDKLLGQREEWNLATLSDVIIHGYKNATGGALGSEPLE